MRDAVNLRHLMLVDASGYAHRAFHAQGKIYREKDGLPIWAILGFMSMLWRTLGAAQADQPSHAAAVFDAPGKTFRHEIFPAYKTNRPARDLELSAQLPFMRHGAEAMGLVPVEQVGFEADDLIASMATRAVAQGFRVTIVSSDKDFLQLVQNNAIEIVDPLAKERRTARDALSRFGVHAVQVPEVQALSGDTVDNIPGVPGMGGKAAAFLIRTFGSVENVWRAAKTQPGYFVGKQQRATLETGLDNLLLYRTLATLVRTVPASQGWDELELQPIMRAHVHTILKTLGATSRFESLFGEAPKTERYVTKITDPLIWWEAGLKMAPVEIPAEPQCGFYKRRLVKGGPWVPARIWREAETDYFTKEPTGKDILRCTVGTKSCDAAQEWPRLAPYPVKQSDYEYMTATAEWAKVHAPNEPEANPAKPIDWNGIVLK